MERQIRNRRLPTTESDDIDGGRGRDDNNTNSGDDEIDEENESDDVVAFLASHQHREGEGGGEEEDTVIPTNDGYHWERRRSYLSSTSNYHGGGGGGGGSSSHHRRGSITHSRSAGLDASTDASFRHLMNTSNSSRTSVTSRVGAFSVRPADLDDSNSTRRNGGLSSRRTSIASTVRGEVNDSSAGDTSHLPPRPRTSLTPMSSGGPLSGFAGTPSSTTPPGSISVGATTSSGNYNRQANDSNNDRFDTSERSMNSSLTMSARSNVTLGRFFAASSSTPQATGNNNAAADSGNVPSSPADGGESGDGGGASPNVPQHDLPTISDSGTVATSTTASTTLTSGLQPPASLSAAQRQTSEGTAVTTRRSNESSSNRRGRRRSGRTRSKDTDEDSDNKARFRRRVLGCWLCICLILVGAGLAVTFIFFLKKDDGTSTSNTNGGDGTTATPTEPYRPFRGENDSGLSFATARFKFLQWALAPLSSVGDEIFDDESSPQYAAVHWLAYDDTIIQTIMDDDTLTEAQTRTRIENRYALATFYYATSGEDWEDQCNFLSVDRHECDWCCSDTKTEDPKQKLQGVICDDDQQVRSLIFSDDDNTESRNLKGHVPEEIKGLASTLTKIELTHQTSYSMFVRYPNLEIGSLCQLTSLTSLNIACNALYSTIPSTYGLYLTNLQELILTDNQFSEEIPTTLLNLQKLQKLYVDENLLSGNVLSTLGQLTNLRELVVDNNYDLYIPEEEDDGSSATIYNLHQLKKLSLGGVTYRHPLRSDMLLKLTNLEYLNLFNTGQAGTIPTTIGQMLNLRTLRLAQNKYTGTFPWSSFHETHNKLEELDLSHNLLSINIETAEEGTQEEKAEEEAMVMERTVAGDDSPIHLMKRFSNLRSLTLKSMDLTGTFPSYMGSLTGLEHLDMARNKLEGTVPSSMGALTSMTYIDLSTNQLMGTIPSHLGNWTQLVYMDLRQNSFGRGTLEFLCKVTEDPTILIDRASISCRCCVLW